MSMDAGIHVNVHDAHPELTSPTTNVQAFPPDIIDIVLYHLEGDVATLRCCTLVCAVWAALARPYLFRKVVCRPAVPTRTWEDFFDFLDTSPDVARYIRWFTVDGGRVHISNVEVERILEVLERLPLLDRLYNVYITSKMLPRIHPEDVVERAVTTPSARRHKLQVLSFRSCMFGTVMPLYRLLASIAHIGTFAVHNFVLLRPEDLPLGSLDTQISAIAIDGSFSPGKQFWASLRHRLPSGFASGLTVTTRLIDGSYAAASLQDLLDIFGSDVRSVSVNALGASWDLRTIVRPHVVATPVTTVDGTAISSTDFLAFYPIQLDMWSLSIRTLVLYFTVTSMRTGRDATTLYSRLLENNWRIVSNAPASITNIELRFQRYGPHTDSVLDDVRAINDPVASQWAAARWNTLDEGTLTRFPHLEVFLCVLCDGGFLEQYGPFQGVDPVASGPSCSRQEEYDSYVELLKGVLPRLHERGLLRFKKSDV
ncbi:hypothetical protein OH76DRAFT_889005 [Lentinus brumalis]|uniref:F-box domain-containing protein n=1 Tax=Lentinus brumalis TaxID=2498619 RepID=A0A371D1E4_9APHY|nr:hypothetical protein OH76DRAFT_889005 [Polyporus brumalis]